MTVTFGFYDSLSGDRKYNAEQMSKLFEGIITEGVFQSVGGALMVSSSGGMGLNVASGRAWFGNTWTNNDANFPVTLEASEVALDRVDSIVVEVNKDLGVRANSIKVIKGTPASVPVAPTLSNTATLKQRALAWVFVGMGVTSVTQANVVNMVGSDETPFITGIVDTIDVDQLMAQYEAQFNEWFATLQDELDANQAANLLGLIQDEETARIAADADLQDQIDLMGSNNSFMVYNIAPTFSSGNLTLALKTAAGVDASPASPIDVKVGPTLYTITGALSTTKNAGTNWFNAGSTQLSAKAIDYFVYLIGETGANAGLKIGFSRIPHAKFVGDFNIAGGNTDEKWLASNITNHFTTDHVQNIGRFRAALSGAYSWSSSDLRIIHVPIFETEWLNWNPVHVGFSVVPQGSYRYQVKEGLLSFQYADQTPGTSNSTSFSVTLPFTHESGGGDAYALARIQDNSSPLAVAGRSRIATGSNVMSFATTWSGAGFTASGTKGAHSQSEIRI